MLSTKSILLGASKNTYWSNALPVHSLLEKLQIQGMTRVSIVTPAWYFYNEIMSNLFHLFLSLIYQVSQRTHKCITQATGDTSTQSGDLLQQLLQFPQKEV